MSAPIKYRCCSQTAAIRTLARSIGIKLTRPSRRRPNTPPAAPGYIAEAPGHVSIVVNCRERVLLGAFMAAPRAADAIGRGGSRHQGAYTPRHPGRHDSSLPSASSHDLSLQLDCPVSARHAGRPVCMRGRPWFATTTPQRPRARRETRRPTRSATEAAGESEVRDL
jgi:hypothetical protein